MAETREEKETAGGDVVVVGDRAFELGRPRASFYLHILRLAKDVYKAGRDALAKELGLDGGDVQAALENVDEIDMLLVVMGLLEERDLNRLGAILLLFDDLDEGVEFVESVGGLDPVWAMDAFAILCEKADIGRVMDSFRRAQKAIRSWSAGRAD